MLEADFLRHFLSNAPQMMWFLGAGTSRTAGMPTATDITWDLKLKYYCLKENQDIQRHDINNDIIKRKIQNYMDSKGFPKLWSPEEYSFYFDLTFGENYGAQQKYISDQLSFQKMSLNIGHRSLAALIHLGLSKVIFTTNFDEVIEQAYSEVAGQNLFPFHLEGAYAALDSLNAEKFPIYAKIHGDFRYQSIKNLTQDLIDNDKKIQDCFLAASNRYGLVVSGYSGRDNNVMSMLQDAINQHNAFPAGIFWTVISQSSVAEPVKKLIEDATSKGIKASIVETGTFDIMLSKIWRQVPNKPEEIDKNVRTALAKPVSIPSGPVGQRFPVLRSNALPIIECPKACGVINAVDTLSQSDLKKLLQDNRPNAVIIKTEEILGWGSEEEFYKALGRNNVISISRLEIEYPQQAIKENTMIKSFYERALAISLCEQKPLHLKNDNQFFLTIDHKKNSDPIFHPLKLAVGYRGEVGAICGAVPRSSDVFWSEAVSIKLEQKNDSLWLMLRPEIWISPSGERRNHIDFIKFKKSRRYNSNTNAILDAWITMLFGSVGTKSISEVQCYRETEYPAIFKINTRTSYSRRAG